MAEFLINLFLIPPAKCSFLSKKPLFAAKWRSLRKLQLDAMQRSLDFGEPSPNGYVYIPAPASVAQWISLKRGQKDSKSQSTGKSGGTVSPRNGCINETRAMALSVDILTWKGRFSWTPTHRQRTAGKALPLGQGEIASPGMSSLVSCTMLRDQPWSQIRFISLPSTLPSPCTLLARQMTQRSNSMVGHFANFGLLLN